jgi:hypothetical protein
VDLLSSLGPRPQQEKDFEVPGTHIGLAFNASAYSIIARRLALARIGDSSRR